MWNLFKKKDEPSRFIYLYNLQQIQAGERLCNLLSIKNVVFKVGLPLDMKLINRECDYPHLTTNLTLKSGLKVWGYDDNKAMTLKKTEQFTPSGKALKNPKKGKQYDIDILAPMSLEGRESLDYALGYVLTFFALGGTLEALQKGIMKDGMQYELPLKRYTSFDGVHNDEFNIKGILWEGVQFGDS
jgi:hypothetical protein